MPPDPPNQTIASCQPIADSIKELQVELKDAQQELTTAVGSEKAALAHAIKTSDIDKIRC